MPKLTKISGGTHQGIGKHHVSLRTSEKNCVVEKNKKEKAGIEHWAPQQAVIVTGRGMFEDKIKATESWLKRTSMRIMDEQNGHGGS